MSLYLGTQLIAGDTGQEAKTIEDTNDLSRLRFWTGTLAEYEALTPDPMTVYNITDDVGPQNVPQLTVSGGDNINVSQKVTNGQIVSLASDVVLTGETTLNIDKVLADGTADGGDNFKFIIVTGEYTGTRDDNTIYLELEP